jgi:hypothetical protein
MLTHKPSANGRSATKTGIIGLRLKTMGTAILDMPSPISSFEIGNIGAFFAPLESDDLCLVRSDERLVQRLIEVMDKLLLPCLESRSEKEFLTNRRKAWPKYLRSSRALSDTISNLLPESDVDDLSSRGISFLSEDLEKQRDVRFGGDLVDQSLFALWTMGKIRNLSRSITSAGDASDKKKDQRLHNDYVLASLWAQFHLDCVFTSIKFDKKFVPDVEDEVCDGVRASVNAYAIMREAMDLRLPKMVESSGNDLPWDTEDDELLAESMREINAFVDNA